MQIAMDFTAPRQRAQLGMQRAIDHAERVAPGWGEDAYRFLREFARTHSRFISEDVSDAHIAAGEDQPITLKAWGAVYQKAARAGLIVRVGFGISRRRHLSPCPMWASQIFGMAA